MSSTPTPPPVTPPPSRPTITVDSGQLCQVLLTKPLTLPALWQ